MPNDPSTTIDLSAFMPVDQVVYEVLDPGKTKKTGWKITLVPDWHPKAQAHSTANTRETLRRQARIEQAQVNGKKWKPEEKEPDEVRRENVDWVVSRIVDWTPVKIPLPGLPEVLTFSDENARVVLMRPEMNFVYAQLVELLVEEKTFTRPSAKS